MPRAPAQVGRGRVSFRCCIANTLLICCSRKDDADIEDQVSALRTKLLAALPQPSSKKPTDTHAMAAAKKAELAKMARALGTRADYQEGEAFDREKQEEHRLKRTAEREERERRREEDRERMAAQKAKWGGGKERA